MIWGYTPICNMANRNPSRGSIKFGFLFSCQSPASRIIPPKANNRAHAAAIVGSLAQIQHSASEFVQERLHASKHKLTSSNAKGPGKTLRATLFTLSGDLVNSSIRSSCCTNPLVLSSDHVRLKRNQGVTTRKLEHSMVV